MASKGIILASGSGQRLKSVTHDKMLLRIGAGSLVAWSVKVFTQSGLFDQLVITYRDKEQKEAIAADLATMRLTELPIEWVAGGERRQDSVVNALDAVSDDAQWVFIHDGARPFITVEDLHALEKAAKKSGGAALAKPVTNTIKRADKTGVLEDLLLEDLDRPRLYSMETPQVFSVSAIKHAYGQAHKKGVTVTDCVAAYQLDSKAVTLVMSRQNNLKVTHPEDVELANFLVHTGSIKKVFELAYQ
jgi:2-C-methyl-D-erythritol 4-phosphate cytidylyltransferase